MTENEHRSQLVEFGASLFARGYSVGGAGNISLRLPDGRLLASPTNASLGRLVPDRLATADMNGKHLGGDAPTRELPLHLAVYSARPGCRAIVHLHSTYATAFSCLDGLNTEDALRPFTPYYVMKIGKLPVAPYYRPGSLELAAAAGEAARKNAAFLLANHGSVVCGSSLVDAVNSAEELEETIKLHFLLQAFGNSVRYLAEGEVAELAAAGGGKK